MKTAALIFAGTITDTAFKALDGGASAYERALAFAESLPGFEGALILEGGRALPAGPHSRVRQERWTVPSILETAENYTASLVERGIHLDALVLVRADEPLIDSGLAIRMLENYRRYRADYCFADGYPLGLAAEILHPRILPALRLLADKHPIEPDRGWLFSLIQKDINTFDIETEISPHDLRDLRLVLACDSKRNLLLVERLLAAGVHDAATAIERIPERLDLQRSLPAFVQVQITGGCPQTCNSCPYPLVGGDILSRRDFMPLERFGPLMEAISDFSGDAVIDLSLWGEPALHPAFPELVEEVLGRSQLSLIVETSGIGWKREILEGLAARWGKQDPSRFNWVISLDSIDATLYRKLRGPGFEEAISTAGLLLELFPKSAYVQTVRTVDNEAELEDFWRGWKKRTENVIVQKYSTFAGFLPPRKVSDLSPLIRRPCWHLKRDLSVLLDGTVPLCRDCVRNEVVLGRLFDEGTEAIRRRLAEVWAAGETFHRLHIEERYPEPCTECDEYYTYNA